MLINILYRGKHWGIQLFRHFGGERFGKWPNNRIKDIKKTLAIC